MLDPLYIFEQQFRLGVIKFLARQERDHATIRCAIEAEIELSDFDCGLSNVVEEYKASQLAHVLEMRRYALSKRDKKLFDMLTPIVDYLHNWDLDNMDSPASYDPDYPDGKE